MGPESFVLGLVSPRVRAEEGQGPGKLRQRPGHGRCRAAHRFPLQACSVAQPCWSFVPWAAGSVLQHQAVTSAWVPAGVVPGLLCRRTVLSSRGGERFQLGCAPQPCPTTMPHLRSLLCAAPADTRLPATTHQPGSPLRPLPGLAVSPWPPPCSLGAFLSSYRKRNSR